MTAQSVMQTDDILVNLDTKTGALEVAKREAAAFLALKDKEEVLGPAPDEKPVRKTAERKP